MAKTTFATRKPVKVRYWVHRKGEKPPKWVTDSGVSAEDLQKRYVPVGNVIVEKQGGVVVNMLPEHFADEYDL